MTPKNPRFFLVSSSIRLEYQKTKDGKKVNLKYYTGITTDKWINSKQRVKENTKEDKAINEQLTKIKRIADSILDSVDPFTINSKQFAQMINDSLEGKTTSNRTNLFAYSELFLKEQEKKIGKRRADQIRTTVNILNEFNHNLTFDDIDKKFYNKFIDWLSEKDLAKNTTGYYIGNLKRIMNYATDNEVNTNLVYTTFKIPREDVFNIYLTEKEIENIYRLKITTESILKLRLKEVDKRWMGYHTTSQINALEQAKKLFVVGCWTGLRVGNYLDIDPDIQVNLEEGFIHAIANKGGKKLKIPMHSFVKEIMREGLPKPISVKHLIKQIRRLGQLADINEPVMYSKTIGGKIKKFSKPKYELIVTHTARRSFASNMELKGAPRQFVMAVTGHSTESSYLKYIQQVLKDEMSLKLAEYLD